jgi:PAS domain S-box-containing protein
MPSASSPPRAVLRGVAAAEPVPDGRARALGELAAALEESEARYRAVMSVLEDGITLHDTEGRILSANESAGRILGAPEAELVGLSLSEPTWECVDTGREPLLPEEHPVSLALGGEPTARALVGLRDRLGEFHWLLMTATRIPADGAGALCLFSDVTFSRLEEEQRGRTEMNFRTLIERTPEGVAVYQNDALAYANPKMVALLGYDAVDEMLGRPPADLVHPDDRAMIAREMDSTDAQPTEPAEERLLRRDGAAVPVEVTTIPTYFNGMPATLVHARDLTERKRLETQVVMADRLASVGRLAAAVGHEINNPLAYVMANLDLALERLGEPGVTLDGGPDDEAPGRLTEILEMLREAREGADRVRHIVRDLKVFSRGEAEERTRIDPRQVIDSCVNMAQGEIRQRARVVKDYGDTPRVLVNQARLGQVLLNLLINAAHAVPEGDPQANEIRVTTRTDADGRVVIEVKDSGAGIPEDVKARIFEPFFTTKASKSGTGLGLSICQNIVTALGGRITFESEAGKGTAFQVILPAAPA